MAAFADFVTTEHGWYKHLRWWPPGVEFVFYLDPAAAVALVRTEDGAVDAAPRPDWGFHYSDLPTALHRERFRALTFTNRHGNRVVLARDFAPISGDDPYFDPRTGARRPLPPLVATAGSARISGLVLPMVRHAAAIARTFPPVPRPHAEEARYAKVDVEATLRRAAEASDSGEAYDWPAAAGGRAQLARIVARVAELMEEPGRREPIAVAVDRQALNPQADRILEEPLEPERRRQAGEIAAACQRVCSLAFGDGKVSAEAT